MKSRHRAREVAFQILYRYDVSLQSTGTQPPTGMALADELQKHFAHFQVPEGLREFAAELVVGTLTHMPRLDEVLERHAQNWKISRMSVVDRSLLRMSLYEMLHFADIPPSVTIDEAVELAKQFGTADSSSFINGILDSAQKEKTAQSAAL